MTNRRRVLALLSLERPIDRAALADRLPDLTPAQVGHALNGLRRSGLAHTRAESSSYWYRSHWRGRADRLEPERGRSETMA